jgi:hypothetical protein
MRATLVSGTIPIHETRGVSHQSGRISDGNKKLMRHYAIHITADVPAAPAANWANSTPTIRSDRRQFIQQPPVKSRMVVP